MSLLKYETRSEVQTELNSFFLAVFISSYLRFAVAISYVEVVRTVSH